MSTYSIRKTERKDGTFALNSKHTYITEESIGKYYSLYLTDELYRNENGGVDTYYRLHSTHPHDNNMVLAYDVYCPKCGREMRQITTIQDAYTLGYYECKHCNKK